jgi:hypothetical protein
MPSSTCRCAWFNYTSVAPLPSIPIDGAGPRHNRPSGTEVFKVRTYGGCEARETSAATTHSYGAEASSTSASYQRFAPQGNNAHSFSVTQACAVNRGQPPSTGHTALQPVKRIL